MNFEVNLIDILEIVDAESVNATDSTMGAAGGAILEGISWVYVE